MKSSVSTTLKQNQKVFLIIVVILIIAANIALGLFLWQQAKLQEITDFISCAKAGFPVLESYPAQCITSDGRHFTQDITITPVPSGAPTEGVICTMDAKLCPDGSSVGRIGPNCEFDSCPEAK